MWVWDPDKYHTDQMADLERVIRDGWPGRNPRYCHEYEKGFFDAWNGREPRVTSAESLPDARYCLGYREGQYLKVRHPDHPL